MIHSDDAVIRRHRNLCGIVVRVPTYVVMARGLWRHRLGPVAAGLAVEGSLWTVMPEVDVAPGPIEDAIQVELRWLNASTSGAKWASYAALAGFSVLVPVGLWRRAPRVLGLAAALLLVFNALMRHVARAAPADEGSVTSGSARRRVPTMPSISGIRDSSPSSPCPSSRSTTSSPRRTVPASPSQASLS